MESVSYALLWATSLAALVMSLIVMRQMGEMYLVSSGIRSLTEDGLEDGDAIPEFRVRTVGDKFAKSFQMLMPAGGLVIFASKGCPLCKRLLDTAASDAGFAERVLFVFDSLELPVPELPGQFVLAESISDKLYRRFRVRVSPFAYVVSQDRQVLGSGIVNSWKDVERLSEKADVTRAKLGIA